MKYNANHLNTITNTPQQCYVVTVSHTKKRGSVKQHCNIYMITDNIYEKLGLEQVCTASGFMF